jgi:hypothetical protein
MTEGNNELKEFIQESLRQIKEAHTGGNRVVNTIKFEVAVSKKNIGGGKIGITVLGQGIKGGKESSIEHASKISFETYLGKDENPRRDYFDYESDEG